MTTEEMQKQIESQMPDMKKVLEKMDRDLDRKKKLLIYQGIGLIIKLLIEIAVIGAVIWLCVKQCS